MRVKARGRAKTKLCAKTVRPRDSSVSVKSSKRDEEEEDKK